MNQSAPPKLLLRFFRWFCHPELRDTIEGDLIELYKERVAAFGKRSANAKFALDVLLLFRPGIIKPAEGYHNLTQYGMFKNYFKVAVRNILKYKVFSFINVFGLAAAMSVCMLIILMLADQNRYDDFHTNKSRTYRILSNGEGFRQPYATSPYPLAAALKAEYPIVEEATHLTPAVGGDATYNQHLVEMRGYFTDPSFFKVFSFELEKGDKATALAQPNSMVISSDIAYQLFNDQNPIGKVVEFTDRNLPFPQDYGGQGAPAVSWGNFTITGVVDEHKYKSHLKFDVLVSSSSLPALYAEKKTQDFSNNWEWYFKTYTFALLQDGKTANDLGASLNDLVAHKYADIKSEQTKGFKLQAQNLADVQTNLMGNDTNNRLPRIGYYFLTFLAIIIMLSACLNYTNLSTARALTRAREIGVRKVTGAGKGSLVLQFLSEAIVTALLALAMAIVMLIFIKPAFKSLWVNKFLEFELPNSPSVYLAFIAFALLIGLLAGFYPALYLSKYQPVQALKNLNSIQPGRLGLRKVLSVSQFVISLFFITTSILIFNQFKHFMSFDYGFTSSNIVNIELQGADPQKLTHEFGSIAGVSTISACDIIPATGKNNGIELKKSGSTDEYTKGGIIMTDENFIGNLGVKIIAGQNLPPTTQASNHFILVNAETAKRLGYKYPQEIVGQSLETKDGVETLQVVGVVEDFRYQLLLNRDQIDPLILRNQPASFNYLNVKITAQNLMGTVALLESSWRKVDPIHPFKYEFFDQQLAATHQGIFDLVSILGFIAVLAIIIACLGMLGMATYTAERKKKEVGIRKVLGAEVASIAVLLSRSFLKVLLLAVAIGAPLSYFVNNLWLQKFPNRVEFGLGTVLLGTAVLLLLGLITIASQTIRASKSNPVDALKME